MIKGQILIVDDEQGMRQYLQRLLSDNGYAAGLAADGGQALEVLKTKIPDVVLLDFKMPGMDGLQVLEAMKKYCPDIVIIMMTAYGTMENAVRAMKLGAFDFLRKPFEMEEILLIIDKAVRTKRLAEENSALRRELKKSYTFSDIVSENKRMHKIFEIIQKVAQTKSTVLLEGETGTGKELIARAIHNLSGRKDKLFVPVDCGGLSAGLLESELFGHVKGAFTGATVDKKGLFETADGGTVFLDEISRISLETQAKLLRVLQEGQIKKVGEAMSHNVDIRLVAAGNENMEQAVAEGRFRQDLFYRLNVVPVHIPPLRERKEDIPLLVEHFIAKYNRLEKKNLQSISSDALKLLMEYQWPGNVRELENFIHRAVVMETGECIQPEDLPAEVRDPLFTAERRDVLSRTLNFRKAKKSALEAFEKRFLNEALFRNHGNVSKAAHEMGTDRRNFHRKLKLYKINPREFLPK